MAVEASLRGRAEPKALRRVGFSLLVAALLVGGLVLRLPGIAEPSIEQRETQSALLARQWALGDGAGLPLWQQRVLRALPELVRPIEPPIIDSLAALSFRLGGENFWFPRLLSSLFWVAGGVFLVLIALRLTSPPGALIALGLYLSWPFAAWLSRHWMPDALLVCCLLLAAHSVIRYWEQPGRGRLLAAGALSSLATAIKPGVASFFLVGLFVALAISHGRLRSSLKGPMPAFVALTAAAAVGYYLVGTRLTDFIWTEAARSRITPSLVAGGSFWGDWWDAVSNLLRYPQPQAFLAPVALVAGLSGIALARGNARAILLGLLLGYVAFSLTFASFVSTNSYYSLPLVPILALAIGSLAGRLLARTGQVGRVAIVGLVALVVAAAAYKSSIVVRGVETSEKIADYERIGDLTGHTTWALVLDRELSTPAMFWGWLVGPAWDLVYEEPPAWIEPERAKFLILVGMGPLDTHDGLRAFLRGRRMVAKTDRYAVFDLRGQATAG